MKLGMNVSIDVTKLDKSKFYNGKKGTYANLTLFVDTGEADQYGNHGSVIEAQSKEDREGGQQKNYVGNAKIFWSDSGTTVKEAEAPSQPQNQQFDEDIPF